MLDAVALLDRAPEGVRRFAYRIAAGEGLLGRVADAARYRFSPRDIPRIPPTSDEPIRLVIGPANSAGQGYQWARAAERALPGVAALAIRGIGSDRFLADTDLRVPVAVYQRSKSWHAAFEAFLSRQTHVIWESGLPMLGRSHGSDVLNEISLLTARGVRGALMFHGSDIRSPSVHAAENAWSPFVDSTGPTRALADSAAKNAELAAASGLSTFVSTPDLLRWLPGATWCPVVVDVDRWASAEVERTRASRPVVAHAPSERWLKGTNLIEPMLRRLSDEGVIEYRQVLGVAHSSMPAFYADADIVLDQFLLGSYGVAACEAMASGALVMGHVDEATREWVRDKTGLDVPIHQATIESLEGELRQAAAEPAAFAGTREAGRRFVEVVHDGRKSADALAAFLVLNA